MRIIKYTFLLVLLIAIGLAVYIFTQKGDYNVTRSKVINASKFTVFEYVNDYKNWETFHVLKQNNPSTTFEYKAQTSGKGGSFIWYENEGVKGFMKTISVKENDSLVQKVNFDGNLAEVNWKFKDTVGGTKVTYSTKGSIGLMDKFRTFFEGGITRITNNNIDRTLHLLNKTLDFEMKTFSVKVNGVAQRNASFFIKQSFTCKTSALSRNIKVVMPKLIYFFKKNNIPMAGKPFVIFETTTLNTDLVTVSVCIPTQKLVSMSEGSDVTSGEMEAFTCIKTTLKGDYSHRKDLWKKAQEYIIEKKYTPNVAGKYIEVYSKSIDDVKNPSKWETQLFIPVIPKPEDSVPVTAATTLSEVPTVVTVPQNQIVSPKPKVTPTPNVNSGNSPAIVVPKRVVPKKTDSI